MSCHATQRHAMPCQGVLVRQADAAALVSLRLQPRSTRFLVLRYGSKADVGCTAHTHSSSRSASTTTMGKGGEHVAKCAERGSMGDGV